jgi:hypothetical protein
VMPTRFRTIKLVTYAVKRRGGWLDKQPHAMPTYTVKLPDGEPVGPFNRKELITWANINL